MSTVFSGDAHWETNLEDRRLRVQGHSHRRDHNTFALAGWFLLLAQDGPEAGKLVQLAHPDYRPVPGDPMPVRMPDVQGPLGPSLDVRWVAPGETTPEGGQRIEFAPDSYFYLVPAGVHHSIHSLSLDPPMAYLCHYTGGAPLTALEVFD